MNKKLKIILMRGLPGSGKSTWAKSKVQENPGLYWRINRDLIREMINEPSLNIQEKKAIKMRDSLIIAAINDGMNVIVDDTNLNKQSILDHIGNLVVWTNQSPGEEVSLYNADWIEFEWVDFTDVPLETCIKRDRDRRSQSVGEQVIRGMYHRYLAPKKKPISFNPSLPECILCDIDGTLAKIVDRSPYANGDEYHKDVPRESTRFLLQIIYHTTDLKTILLSARDEKFRPETEAWLETHGIDFDELIMRKEGDVRNDALIKEELLEEKILPRFNVLLVFDDRDRVVQMWRDKGLDCFQVDYGSF